MAPLLPYNFKVESLISEGRTTRDAVEEIKNWLLTTTIPDLPEELITIFLLSCNNVFEATKTTIAAYFKIKNEVPEMFDNRDVDGKELSKTMDTIIAISIPVRLENNTVIHFFKLKDTSYSNFDLVTSMKAAFMILDISQNRNPPNDLVVVMDMKGLGIMHLTHFKLHPVRKFLEFLQEAMPLKIKRIHILNTNYLFDKILALAKAFIKSELMSAIKTHSSNMNMDTFFEECIPARCMPQEYGGFLPTCDELNQRTVEQLQELKQFFENEENLRKSRRGDN